MRSASLILGSLPSANRKSKVNAVLNEVDALDFPLEFSKENSDIMEDASRSENQKLTRRFIR